MEDKDHTIHLVLTAEKEHQWEVLESIKITHPIKIAVEEMAELDSMDLEAAVAVAETGAWALVQMVVAQEVQEFLIHHTEHQHLKVLMELVAVVEVAKKVQLQDLVDLEPV